MVPRPVVVAEVFHSMSELYFSLLVILTNYTQPRNGFCFLWHYFEALQKVTLFSVSRFWYIVSHDILLKYSQYYSGLLFVSTLNETGTVSSCCQLFSPTVVPSHLVLIIHSTIHPNTKCPGDAGRCVSRRVGGVGVGRCRAEGGELYIR